MCMDPGTATLLLSIGSTVMGGIGAIQQGNAAAEAGRYNARVADMNAEMSRRRAKDAQERGAREEQRKRQEVATIKGQQVAAMAANGVDLTFGSPLETLRDTAILGEIDALSIRKNAAREAYDHEVAAVNGKADATLSRMNADASQTGGYLAAAGTILGGASDAYSKYKRPTIGTLGPAG